MRQISNVLFYGTDTLSTAVLSKLHRHGYNVRVVTKHSTSPVYKYCQRSQLPVDVFKRGEPPFAGAMDQLMDLGVVASFGDMVPGDVIKSAKLGFINVHPSLIPKYKGPAPLLHTLLNGDSRYGITILEALPRSFDKGKILNQVPLDVPLAMSGPQFWEHTAKLMARTLVEYLDAGPSFQGIPQGTENATPAPKISPKQMRTLSKVCPHLQTAHQIFNGSRCLDLFKLSPTVAWQGKALKMKEVHLVADSDIIDVVCSRMRTGQFVYHEGSLLLKCAGSTVLGISNIVLPFKDVQTAQHFHRDQCHGGVEKTFQMLYNPENLSHIGHVISQCNPQSKAGKKFGKNFGIKFKSQTI